MKNYHEEMPMVTFCDRCGDLSFCHVIVANERESETGYLDSTRLCGPCSSEMIREGENL